MFGETWEGNKKIVAIQLCAFVVYNTAKGRILLSRKNLYVYLSPGTRLDYVRIDFESNQNGKNNHIIDYFIKHNKHNTDIHIEWIVGYIHSFCLKSAICSTKAHRIVYGLKVDENWT